MGQRAAAHVARLYGDERILAGFAELWQTTARLGRAPS